MSRTPIGEVMVELGVLTPAQVGEVLELLKQRAQGRFGELAVELGFVNQEDLTVAVARQAGLPVLSAAQAVALRPGPALLRLLPASFMREQLVMPTYLDPEQGVLSLLVADPSNLPARRQAQAYAQAQRIRLFVTTRAALVQLTSKLLEASPETQALPPSPETPPASIQTIHIETDAPRRSALLRLARLEGARVELVPDPEQVASLLRFTGARLIVYRQALTEQLAPYFSAWRRICPELELKAVEGYAAPHLAGPSPPLSAAAGPAGPGPARPSGLARPPRSPAPPGSPPGPERRGARSPGAPGHAPAGSAARALAAVPAGRPGRAHRRASAPGRSGPGAPGLGAAPRAAPAPQPAAPAG